ncbi:MAG: hypothetical protein ACOYY3_05730 [Chloroflexota bacterium]
MRKYLPYILLVIGIVLVGVTAWFSLQDSQSPPIVTGDAPQSLAGLPLSDLLAGEEAVAEIQGMHMGDFQISQAVVSRYGSGNILLWVADAGSPEASTSLLDQMAAVIGQGGTPFNPTGIYEFSSRKVYGMEGGGQLHFFFQSGQRVVWMSAEPTAAEQALIEAMAFYP